tara:strand:+ start:1867 stop:3039 length:1173 start_codon:yes stop_codon:yes gene_type:complete
VRRQVFAIEDLEPAPNNNRTITQEALRGLSTSLERFGLLALPIVNVRDGACRIVGGHSRIEALRREGVEEVECVVVKLSEKDERLANLALNNPLIEGDFVPGLTRELLEEIGTMVEEPEVLMAELRLDRLLRKTLKGATGGDAHFDVADGAVDDDEVPPYSKLRAASKMGSSYRLGDHVLQCNRLSEPFDVRDSGEEPAQMAITGIFTRKQWAAETIRTLLAHSLLNADGAVYVATTEQHFVNVIEHFLPAGSCTMQVLCVHEPGRSPRAGVPYRVAAMPVLYGWRSGVAKAFYGGLEHGTSWPLRGKLPSGRMPVEFAVTAIQNSSAAGEIVLDPHVTDGSTVIAAEKTGRLLRGMVPNTKDMDRVRRRWAEFVKGPGADWKSMTPEIR